MHKCSHLFKLFCTF